MEFGLYTAKENGTVNISSFEGLNRKAKGAMNEFVDMLNISAAEYPCLSPCNSRKKIAEAEDGIRAVAPPDLTNTADVTGITGVCDGGFYYNGILKSVKYKLDMAWEWQIEQKGNLYIINGYDRTNNKSLLYYYNVDADNFAEGGKVMHNLIVSCGDDYLFTPYDDNYGVDTYTFTKPDGTVVKNEDFYSAYKEFTITDSNYNTTLCSTDNIFNHYLSVGDEVTIEGFPGVGNGGQIWNIQSGKIFAQPGVTFERNNTIDTSEMISTDNLKSTDICRAVVKSFSIQGSAGGRFSHRVYFDLYNKNGEIVTFKNMTSGGYYCSDITIKKKTRTFDNIAIHHGRIWGSIPSGNQLYASPSDDIFSFSSDDIVNKYGVRIPSDSPGTFTGLCSYNNELLAFKADSTTVVCGSNPNNYSSFVINGVGCIAPESVVSTPDGVIFLANNGFYIYNGAMPRLISEKLNTRYSSAVAGYDGTSYYASAVLPDGGCEFVVYNMKHGIWNKEDNKKAIGFFKFKNNFYVADETSLFKTNAQEPGNWSFTFTRTFDDSFDNKGINEIWIRAFVYDGAQFNIAVATDTEDFCEHNVFSCPGLKNFRCPVRLKISDSYQLKISGTGKVIFYGIEIRKSEGGRRYKDYIGG